MTAFLADIGSFFTGMLTWVGEVITFVTAQPILLVFVIIAVTSIVLGMAKSWLPGRS